MELKVYVIDDEDSVRDSLSALLNTVGHQTETFATASDCLNEISNSESDNPRCLLIDIELPDMSGLDLLSELRRRNELIPAIVMTGHGDEDLESRAAEQNAVGYFQKPFDTSELLNKISGILAPATGPLEEKPAVAPCIS